MSPYYSKRRASHNIIYTVDHTFSYSSKKFICICSHSSGMPTLSNFKYFKTSVGCANGWFSTDSRVCKWTSGSDPRTGTFYQTQVTTNDTGCIVKGALGILLKHEMCPTTNEPHGVKYFVLICSPGGQYRTV